MQYNLILNIYKRLSDKFLILPVKDTKPIAHIFDPDNMKLISETYNSLLWSA